MGILDTLRRGADRAAFETDRLLRLNRLRADLAAVEEKYDAELRRIGELALELIERGELSRPEFAPMVEKVHDYRREIAERQAQIAAVKAERAPGETTPTGTSG